MKKNYFNDIVVNRYELKKLNFIKTISTQNSFKSQLYSDGNITKLASKKVTTNSGQEAIIDIYRVTKASYILVGKSNIKYKENDKDSYVYGFDVFYNNDLSLETLKNIKSSIEDFNSKVTDQIIIPNDILEQRNLFPEEEYKKIMKFNSDK